MMQTDLEKAKELLLTEGYTCVICRRNEVYTDRQRGVKPLTDLLDYGVRLDGFSAADKVIGKATALLYVLLGVKEIYTPVISSAALDILRKNGIGIQFDLEVEAIKNRAGDGFCPMETLVKNINAPHIAYPAIKKKLSELSKK